MKKYTGENTKEKLNLIDYKKIIDSFQNTPSPIWELKNICLV